MTEFTTINNARSARKGNIVAKVVSIGELKSGNSKDGNTWQNQKAVLKDNSGVQEIVLWNDDIGLLEQGKYYMIENPYWSEYKGQTQLSLGKFYKLQDATEEDLIDVDNELTNEAQSILEETATTLSIDERLKRLQELCENIFREIIDLKTQGVKLGKQVDSIPVNNTVTGDTRFPAEGEPL